MPPKYDVIDTSWPKSLPATITAGGNLSAALDTGSGFPERIHTPSDWVTAALSFQASADGTNYHNLLDETGTEISVPAVAASMAVRLTPANWIGIRHLKIRSGTSGTPVTQTSTDKILTVVVLPRGAD